MQDDVSKMSREELEREVRRLTELLQTSDTIPRSVVGDIVWRANLDYAEHYILPAIDKAFRYFDDAKLAVRRVDEAALSIFSILDFVSDFKWKHVLKQRQDTYNNQNTSTQQILMKLANTLIDGDEEAQSKVRALYLDMKNDIIKQANGINTAINKALGHDDCGAALRALKDNNPRLAELLNERLEALRTEHIARDTKIHRAGVHIGVRAIQIEDSGITALEAQWKQIYMDLKSRRDKLVDDELKAWEYFKRMEPFNMNGDDLRTFEKEIHRRKKQLRDKVDPNFRPSSDRKAE
jgi:hypothetical protein